MSDRHHALLAPARWQCGMRIGDHQLPTAMSCCEAIEAVLVAHDQRKSSVRYDSN